MPLFNNEDLSNKKCWTHCSKLKIALTIIILTFLLLMVIILLVVFIKSGAGFCNTEFCIRQTNKLKRGMNLDIDPCDNFYQFVCGNVLKDSSRKNFYVEANETVNRNYLKLYKEEIKDSEHKMVKTAKELFQKCLNTEDIEKDGLASIKDTIESVGGWPVLNHDNSKFDWVQATYKLRELGYPFSVFINVDVTRKLENKEKYYLEITIPDKLIDEDEIIRKNSKNEAVGIMVKIANLFGAIDQNLAEREMREVYDFWQRISYFGPKSPEKYTIEQFQKEYDQLYNKAPFNWLEFLNKLLGPQIAVSTKDYVSIPDPHLVSIWINYFSTTSGRTVGNYMIWKVIQMQLPYLPKRIQNIMKYSTNSTREEFCLEETDKRFILSPIEVINTRNLLPAEERQEMQKIFSDIKSEFLSLFRKSNWMNGKDKEITMENVKKLILIYGLPGDYLNDKILDDMDVDLVERIGDNFLDYLAQANRNFQTIRFRQITVPASNNTMSRIYLESKSSSPLYYDKAENIFIVQTEFSYYVQSDTPRYFKFSLIGAFFRTYFAKSLFQYDHDFGLTQQTKNSTDRLMKCIKNQTQKYNLPDHYQLEIQSALYASAAEKPSYMAYEKWVQNNEEEKLPGTSYTSRQLFWIAGTYCHVPTLLIDYYPLYNDVHFYSNVSLVSKFNNPYFARDFNCPVGSKTNPAVKCPLYL
ncbi:hypothetical protein ILUMI_00716 [Ignelater luminosus]|uniref:Peptidase M13 N-terminal domain-containing protein n=1 Tax=Ignelater luminosus TaxID=2038154 RepID=A0A8K0GI51_IGNLU|nr:hypothetical protein ILUMI_00716 [Ignelater luminosus]